MRYFNSRPHEEVDLTYHLCCNQSSHFNSRPHEEVDLNFYVLLATFCNFNSRPHEEVDAVKVMSHNLSFVFQLTTSRRGRPLLRQCTPTTHTYFNSRPHEEVDIVNVGIGNNRRISTHDLTKRSTILSQSAFAIVIFQLTTSRRGRLPKWLTSTVFWVFQLTTSRRGRRFQNINYINPLCISTHDLTKRSTKINITRIYQ